MALPFDTHNTAEANRFVGGLLPTMTADRRCGTQCPPSIAEIRRRLTPICEKYGITRLDVFGSVARNEAIVGSDVDLIAKFRKVPGLDFFGIADEMEKILGSPVDLLLFEGVEEMDNPYRKASIEQDRRAIYAE